jgi:hypothetical protein
MFILCAFRLLFLGAGSQFTNAINIRLLELLVFRGHLTIMTKAWPTGPTRPCILSDSYAAENNQRIIVCSFRGPQ